MRRTRKPWITQEVISKLDDPHTRPGIFWENMWQGHKIAETRML